MATHTSNYDLIKPEEEDYYDVEEFNANMDVLDEALYAVEQEVDGVKDLIGQPSDVSTAPTVFGKLNARVEQYAVSSNTVQVSLDPITTESFASKGYGKMLVGRIYPQYDGSARASVRIRATVAAGNTIETQNAVIWLHAPGQSFASAYGNKPIGTKLAGANLSDTTDLMCQAITVTNFYEGGAYGEYAYDIAIKKGVPIYVYMTANAEVETVTLEQFNLCYDVMQ